MYAKGANIMYDRYKNIYANTRPLIFPRFSFKQHCCWHNFAAVLS